MTARWTQQELAHARELISYCSSLAEALTFISQHVRFISDAHALANAFKRGGLQKPSSYLKKEAKEAKAASPGKPTTSNQLTRILIVPDTHVPYHSDKAWRVCLKAAQELRPEAIVVIGDFVDCYAVSRYPKDPKRHQNLKWELEQARPMLHELAACTARPIYCAGNHEQRLEILIHNQAPALEGLISIQEQILDPTDAWQWVPYQSWVTIGKMSFSHDVGHAGVNSGRQTLLEFGGNITYGHSHRLGVVYDSTVRGEHHMSLNVGWLGDANMIDYRHRASALRNSHHGFGWVVQDADGLSWAQAIPILEERVCVVDGVRIAL